MGDEATKGEAHGEGVPAGTGAIGMWLFISTEILLFGGLFLLYAMYRAKNPSAFHAASLELSRLDGTLNTCILITSSLTLALSILFLRAGKPGRSRTLVLTTVLLGLAFLVVKGFEWAAKFEHGLYPNAPHLMTLPKGEMLYFGLYFTMTGLHALHVIIGMSMLGVVYFWLGKGKVSSERPVILSNAGLYWHLVDVIWIFLFPLFYLIS
jgi:cytochrome c oxidase subunit III